jgi:superfamily I DNA/RNA helicase
MTALALTVEQLAAVDMTMAGQDCVIEALAGTGKTATLVAIAEAIQQMDPSRRVLYLAFNKAIVTEAKGRFPTNTICRTAHGLAYSAVAGPYRHRIGKGGRMKSTELAALLRAEAVTITLKSGSRRFAGAFLAGMAKRTVSRFCSSSSPTIEARHIPLPELDVEDDREFLAIRDEFAKVVVPLARRYWDDVTNPRGRLPFEHDHYLKMFQLQGPVVDADVILYDEAQDANGCMSAIVADQVHAQRVYVGDTFQQIYEWRGAVNALAGFEGSRTWLTQSFRFGPEIAACADAVLVGLGADVHLIGNPAKPGLVRMLADPDAVADAVLCRTNAEAVATILRALDAGLRPALVGGTYQIEAMVRAAADLQAGRGTQHPELACFANWGEVQDYAENDACGIELAGFVRIVDGYGTDKLTDVLARCSSSEDSADLIVSTAHKAKGREWPRVRIAGDFPTDDGKGRPMTTEDRRLLYVAATRAREVLDVGECAFLRDRAADSVAAAVFASIEGDPS